MKVDELIKIYDSYEDPRESSNEYFNLRNSLNDNCQTLFVELLDSCDFYEVWESNFKNSHNYYVFNDLIMHSVVSNIIKYGPVFNFDRPGEVEVNVENKKGVLTGKRTWAKIGKIITKCAPFLADSRKEHIASNLKNNYTKLEGEVVLADGGFKNIVNTKSADSVFFTTTRYQKSLYDSCMRYRPSRLEIDGDRHPYEAYESGDFLLAHLTINGLLYARCLVHPESKTRSAIYAVSYPAVRSMEDHLNSRGYNKVSDCGKEWEGARLNIIRTENFDGENILLTPYIDFWENDVMYVGRDYIYLTEDSTKGYKVEAGTAEGWVIE